VFHFHARNNIQPEDFPFSFFLSSCSVYYLIKMTTQDNHVVYPQLTSETFEIPPATDDLVEDDEENEVPIVPTSIDLRTQTVRVTRPENPTDFMLQRSLTTEKDLLDLVFR
jgi:hypothetical protein